MKKLKVWGGCFFNQQGKQVRCILAAYTKKRAAEVLDQQYHVNKSYFLGYWVETGNEIEIRIATGSPETLFESDGLDTKNFKARLSENL